MREGLEDGALEESQRQSASGAKDPPEFAEAIAELSRVPVDERVPAEHAVDLSPPPAPVARALPNANA